MNRLINDRVNNLSTNNNDMKRRRTINASPSQDANDYIIQQELTQAISDIKKYIDNIKTNVQTQIPSAVSVQAAKQTIVLFGDSITLESGGEALVYQDPSLSARYSANENGLFAWANTILGQRFKVIFNAGIGGNTTTQMLARIQTDVVSYNPRWCFILGGTNDIGSAGSGNIAIINLAAIYSILNAAGIGLIVATIPSKQGLSGNATATAEWYILNQWIRTNAITNGYILVDLATVYIDVTSIYPIPKSGYSVDGTHPSLQGGIDMGQAVADVLQPFFNQGTLPISNNDPLNLVVNPYFTGTGGTLSHIPGTSVATSWTASFNGPSTAKDALLIADYNGQGFWQQLSFTGGTAGTTEIWIEQSLSGYSALDKLTAFIEYQCDASFIGQLDLTFIVSATNPANRFTSHSGYPVDTVGGQPPSYGVLKTGVGLLPADVTTIFIHAGITGIQGTVRFRRPYVIKV